jgi:hypothetical protein
MYPGGPSSGSHIGPYGAAVIISGAMFSGRRESSVKYAMFCALLKGRKAFQRQTSGAFQAAVGLPPLELGSGGSRENTFCLQHLR